MTGNQMTGNQIFAILIGVILLWLFSSIFDSYVKFKDVKARIEMQQELNNLISNKLSLLIDAEESSVKAMQVLAKRLIELQEEVEKQGKIIQEKLEYKDR